MITAGKCFNRVIAFSIISSLMRLTLDCWKIFVFVLIEARKSKIFDQNLCSLSRNFWNSPIWKVDLKRSFLLLHSIHFTNSIYTIVIIDIPEILPGIPNVYDRITAIRLLILYPIVKIIFRAVRPFPTRPPIWKSNVGAAFIDFVAWTTPFHVGFVFCVKTV